MTNHVDTAVAGFLIPASPSPDYDDDLVDILGDTVAGITGLDRNAVRPRWVPDPASQPARPVNWCAVGVTDIESETFASTVHDGQANAGDGASTVYRDVQFSVLASFYGPDASGYAALLRDGFVPQQNRAAMLRRGIAFVRNGRLVNTSGLVNTENLSRYDLPFVLRRRDARTYAIPNMRSVAGAIVAAHGGVVLDPVEAEAAVDIIPFQVG